jgi:hypothetical protein
MLTGGNTMGDRAARRHRQRQGHARVAVEDHQLAGGGVDRGDQQRPRRPVRHRQAGGDHLDALGLGDRGCGQRPGAHPRAEVVGAGGALRQLEPDGAHGLPVELGRRLAGGRRGIELLLEQPVEADAAGELRADDRARRGADQQVGVADRRAGSLQAQQHAQFPGDAGHAAGAEHQCSGHGKSQ